MPDPRKWKLQVCPACGWAMLDGQTIGDGQHCEGCADDPEGGAAVCEPVAVVEAAPVIAALGRIEAVLPRGSYAAQAVRDALRELRRAVSDE